MLPAGAETWKIWNALTYTGKSTEDALKIPMLSYGAVQACTDSKRYQVEVKTEMESADHKSQSPGPSELLQVLETGNSYRIHDASLQAEEACTGRVIALKSTGY